MKKFVDHLQRSCHVDQEYHDEHQDMLEDAFHCGQDENAYPLFHNLSSRPAFLFEIANMNEAEGSVWKAKYQKHCQLMFSSFQHHWHKKDSEGHRQPLPYCRTKQPKGTTKQPYTISQEPNATNTYAQEPNDQTEQRNEQT